jgi:acyl-CoA thioesterase-1
VVLVVGDSISAAYGLSPGTGGSTSCRRGLRASTIRTASINASITGDTTAGGRARLPALLMRYKPAVSCSSSAATTDCAAAICGSTRDNLGAMVEAAQRAGAKPLIVGMQMPPNYGGAYVRKFSALFGEVAKAHNAPLVPFFSISKASGSATTCFRAIASIRAAERRKPPTPLLGCAKRRWPAHS